MVIKASVLDPDKLFSFEGLDYQKDYYIITYGNVQLLPDKTIDINNVTVGLRHRNNFNIVLSSNKPVTEWSNGLGRFEEVTALVAYITSLINFSIDTNIGLTQKVPSFSDLVSGVLEGDLAYVENSEGTAWLPGTVGGSYYPKGWYVWNGTDWVSDRNAIAAQFEQNIFTLNNKANVADLADVSFSNNYEDLDNKPITGISADADNAATIGSDGQIFVPQSILDSASVDLRWLYRSETTPTDPTPNFIKTNNTNPALVTELYMSELAYPNRNVENILEIMGEGDQIYLQQNNSSEQFINGSISSTPVDTGDFWIVPIEIVTSGDSFTPNQFCNVIMYHANGGGGTGTGGNVPNGGLKRQVLEKRTNNNNDYIWKFRYFDFLINVEYTGNEFITTNGKVLETVLDGDYYYRFISDTINTNNYPDEDSFYGDFTGSVLVDLITTRG